MVCLGFEPWAAGLYVQAKPRSYGGRPIYSIITISPSEKKANQIGLKMDLHAWKCGQSRCR